MLRATTIKHSRTTLTPILRVSSRLAIPIHRTLSTSKTASRPAPTRVFSNTLRGYSTAPSEAAIDASEPSQDAEQAVAALVDFLEKARSINPPDDAGRLIISYAIIYEIIRFLARHGEGSEAYLAVFMNSEASEESIFQRARNTILQGTQLLVSRFSGVPATSPLRNAHPQLFGLFGALEVLLMAHEVEPQPWRDFWGRAQPLLLDLAAQLDEAGFGAD
ncbi:hypothetical protein FB45DRAFT_1007333 [Roridomyces roridus]|uniref:Uncharacterized protein n=1 Tax=Roridomyces roridus TaxID=1738132 RepID=A0AAD7BEF7_9AGAR|nr:hypothetical protein FB45DRAFT_1007333 [Roridomyces roridus]